MLAKTLVSCWQGLRLTHLTCRHKQYPPVVFLTESDRKRILITGGAGFVGSHPVDTLLREGHEVSISIMWYSIVHTGRQIYAHKHAHKHAYRLIHTKHTHTQSQLHSMAGDGSGQLLYRPKEECRAVVSIHWSGYMELHCTQST